MEQKIIKLLETLYNLSLKERQEFGIEISKMDEKSKEAFAIALYRRYESFNTNLYNLNKGLQFISNDISSFKEKKEAEKIEFNY